MIRTRCSRFQNLCFVLLCVVGISLPASGQVTVQLRAPAQATPCDTFVLTNRIVNTGGVLSELMVTNDLPAAGFSYVPGRTTVTLPGNVVLTNAAAEPVTNIGGRTLAWDFSSVATPSSINHLLITEVFFNFTPTPGGTKEHFEWFEIFNPTTNAVDLIGWSVQDTAPAQTDALPNFTIAPGEFVIIAGRTNAFLSVYSNYVGQVYEVADGAIGSGLNTFGDGVRLLNDSMTVVDAVSYGNSTAAFSPSVPVPAAGSSIERDPANNDTNTRNDWKAQPVPDPGSGNLPTGMQTGDEIVIVYEVEIGCDGLSGQFFSRAGFEQPPGSPGATVGSAFVAINEPDLVISKTPILQAAGVLDTVTWTVRVENAGFGSAANVVLRDTIGPGIQFTGFSVDPTNSAPWGSTVIWDASVVPAFTNLAAGDYVELTVTGLLVACEDLWNRADAQWGCSDLTQLPNAICEDTELTGETATAGIQFITRYPNLRGSITPSGLQVGYCPGAPITLHLTNQAVADTGPVVDLILTPQLPAGWSISGDQVTNGVIDVGIIPIGGTTSIVVNVQAGGDCPLMLDEQPLYFFPDYNDGCGNPYFGPLFFTLATVVDLPSASVTKVMPSSVSGSAGSFPVRVEFSYENFDGTETVTLTDFFPVHPNLSVTNISAGGVLSGNSVIWSNVPVPAAGSGVVTTSFDMVFADPCGGPSGAILFNQVDATMTDDCQGCPLVVEGSGGLYPVEFSLGVGCTDPGFGTNACGWASIKTVAPSLVEVCTPVVLTHTFTNFNNISDWTGMVFASDLAGGFGTLDTSNEVAVVIDGSNVTAFVAITNSSPLAIDLSGLNASSFPDPSAVTQIHVQWPVSVDIPGQWVDQSTLTAAGCGTQARSVAWNVGESDMDISLRPIYIVEACGTVHGRIDLRMWPSPDDGGEMRLFPAYDVEVRLDLDADDSGTASFEYIPGSTVFSNMFGLMELPIEGFDPDEAANQLTWTIGDLGTNEVMSIYYQLRPGCEAEAGGRHQARLLYNNLCADDVLPPDNMVLSATNSYPDFIKANLISSLQPGIQFITGTQIVVQVGVLNSGAGTAYNLRAELELPAGVSFGSAEIIPTSVTASNVVWEFDTLAGPFGALVDADADGFYDDLPSGQSVQFWVTNTLVGCDDSAPLRFSTSYGCGGTDCDASAVIGAAYVTISGSLVTRATFPAAATLCAPSSVEYAVRNSGLTIDYDVEAYQTFPLGMTYVPGSSEVSTNGSPFLLTDDPPGDGSELSPLTWTKNQVPLLGLMYPNDEVIIRYQVELGCQVTFGNNQFVSRGRFTDNCGDVVSNRQVVSVLQINEPLLQVDKTSSRSIGDIGQTNVYNVIISHHGDSAADVPYMTLTDVLPNAITFVGASVPPDVVSGQTLIWSNATLNALTGDGVAPFERTEDPISITITGVVNTCAGSVINTATVNYGCDADDACLTASDSVSIITSPRLTPPGLLNTLQLTTCGGVKTVNVTNTGATAYGLILQETAPPGYIYTHAMVAGEFSSVDLIIQSNGIPLGSEATIVFTTAAASGAADVKDDRNNGIDNLDLGQNSGFLVTLYLASDGTTLDCLADPTLGNYVDPHQADPTPLISNSLLSYTNLCGETASISRNTTAYPDIPDLDIAILPNSLIVTDNEVVNLQIRVVNNSETIDADGIHVRLRMGSGWTNVVMVSSNIVSSGGSTMVFTQTNATDLMWDFPDAILDPVGDRIELNLTATALMNGDPLYILAEVVGDCGNPLIPSVCTFTNIFGATPLADEMAAGAVTPVNGQYYSFDQDSFNAAGHNLSKTVRYDDEGTGAAGPYRSARVGEDLVFRLEALYFGGEYHNVTITDSLPDEMIFGTPTNYLFTGGATNALWDSGAGTFTLQPSVITNHPFTFAVDIPVTITNRLDLQDGLIITNIATTDFTLQGVTNIPLPQLTTVEVLEPDLEIVKTVSSNLVQAGDIILFTNTLSHTPASSTTAYDIVFTDTLPPGLVFNDFVQPPIGQVSGQTVTFTTNHWAALEAFETTNAPLQFVFEVLVQDQIIGAPIFNTSQATYKSLDGDSFNGNERTGADGDMGLNDYYTESTVGLMSEVIRGISKTYVFSSQTNTLTNGGTNDWTIGERFVYAIRVDVPQGVATNVVITDVVPAGIDWVGSNTNASMAFPDYGYRFIIPAGGPPVPDQCT